MKIYSNVKKPLFISYKLLVYYTSIFRKYPKVSIAVGGIILACYWFSLPSPLFKAPLSVVLEDEEGQLLGAKIASDGQWRFPEIAQVPKKFEKSILTFEDKRFYRHIGIDFKAIGRAILQNIRSRSIVSGGSTITMQVIRMARGNRRRTIVQKVIEIVLATRLELGYSKKDILKLYAAHAPFGGNVVGIEAATWRYFGKKPYLLSWSEAALLAVLPNSPALIHPGRNRDLLLAKRNRLIDQLLNQGHIDSLTWELSKLEELPGEVHPLPRKAPHLLDRLVTQYQTTTTSKARYQTTLKENLQSRINERVDRHQQLLKFNQIHNLAVLVVDVETKGVIAYVGNAPQAGFDHGQSVDIIPAPRSTGSILKPLLFARMLHEGMLMPKTLIPDVPTQLSGYRPENFHERYDGLVSAERALVRSLNVPFVNMLQRYGLEKFHHILKKLEFTHINRPANHYGLPLILGGAECSLWEIVQAYAGMAKTLNHFYKYSGEYNEADFGPIHFLKEATIDSTEYLSPTSSFFSASSIWQTFEAMRGVERPNEEGAWQRFGSGQPIAWKTGTSFGFRDAWAVGISSKYVVGVWAGNADGEGRPGLIGVKAAAPLLFDVFDQFPAADWFDSPIDEMIPIEICSKSGYRAGRFCPRDTTLAAPSAGQTNMCAYHQLVHLDANGEYQVNIQCEPNQPIQSTPWFILPPLEAFYYQSSHPDYKLVPPIRQDCKAYLLDQKNPMELIYPKYPTAIYVPIDLDGAVSRTVFSVAHQDPESTIHWHVDEQYLGSTEVFHHLELNPLPGKHQLTLVDTDGRRLELPFEIIPR